MTRSILLLVFILLSGVIFAQSKSDDAFLKEYEARTQKEYLDRIYIPRDIKDAHEQLDQLMDKEARLGLMRLTEAEAPRKYHFILGRWLIKNWSLDRGSRLSKNLREKGIFRPDDMAKFIVLTYYRKLHFKPLNEPELLAQIQAKYAAEKEERSKYKQVLHSEKRIRKHE